MLEPQRIKSTERAKRLLIPPVYSLRGIREFSVQILKFMSDIKFHKNPSNGTKLFHAENQTKGRTNKLADSNYKAKSRFTQFCERGKNEF